MLSNIFKIFLGFYKNNKKHFRSIKILLLIIANILLILLVWKMALSQCLIIVDNNIILTKFSLFLQSFLSANINVNILKLSILTFLLVSLNILTYCISKLLFIIVSGAIVRYSFKSYFSLKNGNDFSYMGFKRSSAEVLEEGAPYLKTIEVSDKAAVVKEGSNLSAIEQLIIKPEVAEVLDKSAELSNTGINLGWWILGGAVVVVLIIVGIKIYNNTGGDVSNSISNINEKLIKVDENTSLRLNEVHDSISNINEKLAKVDENTLLSFNEVHGRVTYLSTRVTKMEDIVKGAANRLDSADLRGLHTAKQVLAASKQALESGSVAEAAYISAYNLSKAVPNLEARIAAIERRLNDS